MSFVRLHRFAGSSHAGCKCRHCALCCFCILAWALAISVNLGKVFSFRFFFSSLLIVLKGNSLGVVFLLSCFPADPVRHRRIWVTSVWQIPFCLAGTFVLQLVCAASYIIKLRGYLIVCSIPKDGLGSVEHISYEIFNLKFNFNHKRFWAVKNFKLWLFTVTVLL